MYCAKCDEMMANHELIQDEQGYEHPYDRQICRDCRIDIGNGNVLTDAEVDYALEMEIK